MLDATVVETQTKRDGSDTERDRERERLEPRLVCHPWSEMRGCAAREAVAASAASAAHEREKRFYTLNGADKLYHMAFVVSFSCFFSIVDLLWLSSFHSRSTSRQSSWSTRDGRVTVYRRLSCLFRYFPPLVVVVVQIGTLSSSSSSFFPVQFEWSCKWRDAVLDNGTRVTSSIRCATFPGCWRCSAPRRPDRFNGALPTLNECQTGNLLQSWPLLHSIVSPVEESAWFDWPSCSLPVTADRPDIQFNLLFF